MKLYFKVTSDYELLPADDEAIAWLYKKKPNSVIEMSVKMVRNYDNHKRFFKFLQITFDMQDFFDNLEYYRYWITMKCGRFDTITTPAGATIYKAHSLSFADMDEDEFKQLFSDAIDVFLKNFGGGLDEEALLEIIRFS